MLRADSVQQPLVEPQEPRTAPAKPWVANMVFVALVHLVAGAAPLLCRPRAGTVVLCLVIWQAAGLGTGTHSGPGLKG